MCVPDVDCPDIYYFKIVSLFSYLWRFYITIYIYIFISDKPNIIEHSNRTTIVSEGGTAELWCNATSPVPMNKYNTTWFIHSNTTDRSIGNKYINIYLG